MKLKFVDYGYIALCCVAGIWQAWCFNYGPVTIVVAMGLPFALMTYSYASFVVRCRGIADRPHLKVIFFIPIGMLFSLAIGALAGAITVALETTIAGAPFFQVDNLPFDASFPVIEGAACIAWSGCLLLCFRQLGLRLSRNQFLVIIAVLLSGVAAAAGLSELILRQFHKDVYLLLASVIETLISAAILVVLNGKAAGINRVAQARG